MTDDDRRETSPADGRSGNGEDGAAGGGHLRGLAYVFVAGVLYASAGVFTRGLSFDAWTLVAWRSLSGAAFLTGLSFYENRRMSFRDFGMGAAHWTLVPIGAVATICYIFALKITTVANVMIVYATTPFVTAVVAFVWLREVPGRRLMVASSVALVGVLVMLVGGPTTQGSLAGTGMILFMNLSFALTLVLARRSPERSMTPVNALSLLLASLISFAAGPAQALDGRSLLLMVLFGVVTVGCAMSLFMAGARLAPSSEVALIGISDVVLGPLMVWLLFQENPGLAASAGGAIVMAALLWNIWPRVAGLFRKRSETAAKGFI